ncbi:MAG: L,D-transpeptidase family protein [Bdellovibrionota bacterium]
MKRQVAALIVMLCLTLPPAASAESFLLTDANRNDLVGEVKSTEAKTDDTLVDIARRNDLGYDEIVKSNSSINRWVPAPGEKVLLPTRFILPDAPREGIVINLAELRLYYYPSRGDGGAQRVYSYPISVGRMDWKSPLGKTKVVKKDKEPAWRPTESIKAEHAEEGDPLPDVIPGGTPENPLGHFALRLGIPGYLIHGTDAAKENGIGMRVTHGCVRMYPDDIEQLFGMAEVGTPVTFVDQPLKVGWDSGQLFIEVHSPLEEDEDDFAEYSHRISVEEGIALIRERAGEGVVLDEQKIAEAIGRGDGIPVSVAATASLLPPARQAPISPK